MAASGEQHEVSKRVQRRREWWTKQKNADQKETSEGEPLTKKVKKCPLDLKKDSSGSDTESESGSSDSSQESDSDVKRTPVGTKKQTHHEEDKLDKSKKTKIKKDKKKYFILFVGNLSYTTTEEEIHEHFLETGGLKEVRILTKKEDGDSRGCAYLEFVNSEAHRVALRLHQSTLGGRKINVEFTSAGKKTERRHQRIKAKNEHAGRFKLGPHVDEQTLQEILKGKRTGGRSDNNESRGCDKRTGGSTDNKESRGRGRGRGQSRGSSSDNNASRGRGSGPGHSRGSSSDNNVSRGRGHSRGSRRGFSGSKHTR